MEEMFLRLFGGENGVADTFNLEVVCDVLGGHLLHEVPRLPPVYEVMKQRFGKFVGYSPNGEEVAE